MWTVYSYEQKDRENTGKLIVRLSVLKEGSLNAKKYPSSSGRWEQNFPSRRKGDGEF